MSESTVELIERWAGIRRADRVLDIGCGLGRVAWPLARRLGYRGRYVGFDASLTYNSWCHRELKLDPARFFFCWYPLRSSAYDEGGYVAPEKFEFPWERGLFTLAVATSLFTHLLPEATENYLRQMRRVLQPGGRVFATFFLVDEGSMPAIAAGATYPTFTEATPWGWLHDPAIPEDGVAYAATWLMPRLETSGFAVQQIHLGSWRGNDAPHYQDVIVATAI